MEREPSTSALWWLPLAGQLGRDSLGRSAEVGSASPRSTRCFMNATGSAPLSLYEPIEVLNAEAIRVPPLRSRALVRLAALHRRTDRPLSVVVRERVAGTPSATASMCEDVSRRPGCGRLPGLAMWGASQVARRSTRPLATLGEIMPQPTPIPLETLPAPSIRALLLLHDEPALESVSVFLGTRLDDVQIHVNPNAVLQASVGPGAVRSLLHMRPIDLPAPSELVPAVAQTFGIPNLMQHLDGIRAAVEVRDFMTGHLAPNERGRRLLAAILAAHEGMGAALVWVPSAELLSDPEHLLDHSMLGIDPHPVLGLLNVRYIRLEGAPVGDELMDTRGLTAFGLPDLQCHFRGLPRQEVAALLYRNAMGFMVDGLQTHEGTVGGWSVRLEQSMAPPRRTVLDLRPPGRHSGTRAT
ncbi:MAG: DUF4261 domain-containing protein [Deltaproteobacteria bacterium]|nr:MAG: DUF4261 domain-containing protein [Deltaproteobacteria bacterium]